MLTLTNITKTFGAGTVNEKTALNGIDLHLDDTLTRGEVAILLYQISQMVSSAPGLQMYQ